MSDVFISYSRVDKAFVAKLHEALLAKKQNVWIDWESIPPSQSWWTEIQKGIAKANNFVLVLSPNSMSSPICQMEIEYARQLKKRIIPLYYTPYDRDTCIADINARMAKKEESTTREIWADRHTESLYDANDGELKHINYFFFKPDADFEARFEDLFKIIRTDYAHKEQHTTLELRAQEWDRRQRDSSFLLLDNELLQAQAWLTNAANKEPAPTALHHAYIQASEKRTRQLRNIRRTSIIGSAVAGVAIVLAVAAALVGIQANTSANLAETREAAANLQVTSADQQLATATIQQGLAQQDAATAVSNMGTSIAVQATAQQGAHVANTQVAVAAVTATHSAIIGDITSSLANSMLLDGDHPADLIASMSDVVDTYPDQSLAYNARAAVYLRQGDNDNALADLNRAIELDPDDFLSYSNRSVIYSNLNRYDEALADLNSSIELDPEYALNYYSRGQLYSLLDRYDEALADFTHAIELDPTDIDSYNSRADIYNTLDRYDEALADLNLAIELDPKSFESYVARGVIYENLERYDEALADYNHVIELDPKFAAAYSYRAVFYFDQGQVEQAMADINTAVQLAPNDPNNYDSRCFFYLASEQWALGVADCDKALSLDPTWTFSDDLQPLLDEAREHLAELTPAPTATPLA